MKMRSKALISTSVDVEYAEVLIDRAWRQRRSVSRVVRDLIVQALDAEQVRETSEPRAMQPEETK